ncbi:hypothetical protein ACJMK2_026985 [Sinanodonta woodiana]|uniref:Uncharacterized protein n=1 Tax=Sinanodonta woodiana TaxID=1069815 RepID=A0ABD3XLD7_SINWO
MRNQAETRTENDRSTKRCLQDEGSAQNQSQEYLFAYKEGTPSKERLRGKDGDFLNTKNNLDKWNIYLGSLRRGTSVTSLPTYQLEDLNINIGPIIKKWPCRHSQISRMVKPLAQITSFSNLAVYDTDLAEISSDMLQEIWSKRRGMP